MGLNEPQRAPAVHRAVSVLAFLAQGGPASATEISRDLGLAKSSTSDLIGTMQEAGLLSRRVDDLSIGPLLGALTEGLVGDSGVLERFATHWPRQRTLTDHTVSVQSILGDRNLCMEVRLGRHLLPYTPRAGSRTTVWSEDGTGDAILRALMPADVERTMTAFAGFDETNPDDQTRHSWLKANAVGRQDEPVIAATSNREFNVQLPHTEGRVPPVLLTLHLPPRLDVDVAPLRSALHDFAEVIGGALTRSISQEGHHHDG